LQGSSAALHSTALHYTEAAELAEPEKQVHWSCADKNC
jgi:hypothetical protein